MSQDSAPRRWPRNAGSANDSSVWLWGARTASMASDLQFPRTADDLHAARSYSRPTIRNRRQASAPRTPSLGTSQVHGRYTRSEAGRRGQLFWRSHSVLRSAARQVGITACDHRSLRIGLDLSAGLLAPCSLGRPGTGWQHPSLSGTMSCMAGAYLRWYGRGGAGSSGGS